VSISDRDKFRPSSPLPPGQILCYILEFKRLESVEWLVEVWGKKEGGERVEGGKGGVLEDESNKGSET
jgi:hypothetical protein